MTQKQQLQTYKDLLLQWTAKVNLIGPEARENLDAHIDEALEAAGVLLPRGEALDFGSGGGLPAIPMAIMSPEARFHLVESDQKKWSFLKFAVRECALNSVVHGDRLHRLVPTLPSDLRFDLVTSRAVGKPEQWVGLFRERLTTDGRVALFEGSEAAPSIEGFETDRVVKLSRGSSNYLVVLRRSFHVEHHG